MSYRSETLRLAKRSLEHRRKQTLVKNSVHGSFMADKKNKLYP